MQSEAAAPKMRPLKMRPLSDTDLELVTRLLGHPPRGQFDVVVRNGQGGPVVIRSAPLLFDGTPMPTRYWLVGAAERLMVDRLESAGGVRAAEAAVDPDELLAAHARYAAERDAAVPAEWAGPRPDGGVGGTRRTGVKCLHAHYAWFLAGLACGADGSGGVDGSGGDDPVGRWVQAEAERGVPVGGVPMGGVPVR
ncbi:MAG: uncharacterized protein QOG44_166 [Acidimicrobiaceae bacterium]|nr:uncharacterized protein [Acidimicrobiaceae bacterium]